MRHFLEAISPMNHHPQRITKSNKPCTAQQLVSIPQIQTAILQSTGYHTARVVFGFGPRQVVEAGGKHQSALHESLLSRSKWSNQRHTQNRW